MKRSRFTGSQIKAALKRVEVGLPVLEMCRELGCSSIIFTKWQTKFGGMSITVPLAAIKEIRV